MRRGVESLPLRFLLVVLVALAAPSGASAHGRSGRVAVDYRAGVLRVPPGVTVRIYESDLAVRLTAGTARSVAVLGYLGEPFIRITGAGVAVNDASPTARGRPARQTRTLGCVARRTRERVTAGRRAQALDDPARR